MEKAFFVSILTPQEIIYSGKAISLVVPAELGYLGILANHAPLAANIVGGKITLKTENGKLVNIAVTEKGFLEVLQNKVTLMLSAAQIINR
jgi:F-type H+-transporting ATPase subunit epsilon